jgi:hypothetical protein
VFCFWVFAACLDAVFFCYRFMFCRVSLASLDAFGCCYVFYVSIHHTLHLHCMYIRSTCNRLPVLIYLYSFTISLDLPSSVGVSCNRLLMGTELSHSFPAYFVPQHPSDLHAFNHPKLTQRAANGVVVQAAYILTLIRIGVPRTAHPFSVMAINSNSSAARTRIRFQFGHAVMRVSFWRATFHRHAHGRWELPLERASRTGRPGSYFKARTENERRRTTAPVW